MSDPMIFMMAVSLMLVGLAITSAASLRAWRGWLDLKRLELDAGSSRRTGPVAGTQELRELKERVRKLEAIASGVEI